MLKMPYRWAFEPASIGQNYEHRCRDALSPAPSDPRRRPSRWAALMTTQPKIGRLLQGPKTMIVDEDGNRFMGWVFYERGQRKFIMDVDSTNALHRYLEQTVEVAS